MASVGFPGALRVGPSAYALCFRVGSASAPVGSLTGPTAASIISPVWPLDLPGDNAAVGALSDFHAL